MTQLTLTLQLAIWLGFVIPGAIFQIITSFRTYGRWQVLRWARTDPDLTLATGLLFFFQCAGIAHWSVALGIGLAALFDTNTGPPVGQSLIGQLIVVGLLAFIGLLSFETVGGFVAGERLERQARARAVARLTPRIVDLPNEG